MVLARRTNQKSVPGFFSVGYGQIKPPVQIGCLKAEQPSCINRGSSSKGSKSHSSEFFALIFCFSAELNPDLYPVDSTCYLSSVIAGLGVQAANGATRAEMKRVADLACALCPRVIER